MSVWGDIRKRAEGQQQRKEDISIEDTYRKMFSGVVEVNIDKLTGQIEILRGEIEKQIITPQEQIDSLDKEIRGLTKELERIEGSIRHIKCNNRIL